MNLDNYIQCLVEKYQDSRVKKTSDYFAVR